MKKRLDTMLVDKGLCSTRSQARALIMAGKVTVNGKPVDKAGFPVDHSWDIRVQQGLPYVSRGGQKLKKALHNFKIPVKGKIIMDVGASTGGFTDCALQNGAEKVYAIDVGYGQLDWSLRNNPRVVNMERTNIRCLIPDMLGEIPDIATVDVAFISLKHVFPVLKSIGIKEVIALIKPQFEAGKEQVGKKGVVKDPAVHEQVLFKVVNGAEKQGYFLKFLTFSPLKGPRGNIEYLGYFLRGVQNLDESKLTSLVTNTVSEAVSEL